LREKRLKVEIRAIKKVPLVSLSITVRNRIPRENNHSGTPFPKVISSIYCTSFYWKPYFLLTNSRKIWFTEVFMKITDRNKVPA
jgi:hypothetical protein